MIIISYFYKYLYVTCYNVWRLNYIISYIYLYICTHRVSACFIFFFLILCSTVYIGLCRIPRTNGRLFYRNTLKLRVWCLSRSVVSHLNPLFDNFFRSLDLTATIFRMPSRSGNHHHHHHGSGTGTNGASHSQKQHHNPLARYDRRWYNTRPTFGEWLRATWVCPEKLCPIMVYIFLI